MHSSSEPFWLTSQEGWIQHLLQLDASLRPLAFSSFKDVLPAEPASPSLQDNLWEFEVKWDVGSLACTAHGWPHCIWVHIACNTDTAG